MPKRGKKLEQARAKHFVKTLESNNFNQTETAKQLNITPQALSDRISKKPVQDALTKYLDSPELSKKLQLVAKQGLNAKKSNGKPDLSIRHKFWKDLMLATGRIKSDGGGNVAVINVIYGHRKKPKIIETVEKDENIT